jgi:pilus assembly protein CpaB
VAATTSVKALLITLLVSGAGTYLLRHKLVASSSHPIHIQEQKYAAPARPLQAGDVLKASNLELVDWPANLPLDGAFGRIESVLGREVLFPLDKGQPILEKYLSAPGSGVGLAGKIPDGMRAIALRSDEVVGVAGFLLPGSRLDVLVTYRTDGSPEPRTSTVLQNAEVLAAGHQVQPDPEGKPATVTVVTLLLTPDEAERAVLASTQGSIHFVLRNGSDTERTPTSPVLLSQLSGSPAPSGGAAAAMLLRGRARRVLQVQTILGDQRSTDTFTGADQ